MHIFSRRLRQTVLLKQQQHPNSNMLLPPGTKGVADKSMPKGFDNTVVADGWGASTHTSSMKILDSLSVRLSHVICCFELIISHVTKCLALSEG